MALAGIGRFELIRRLGEGGMGVVYEARDRRRDMTVALKTLRRTNAAALFHFKREFRALTEVSHPNIVSLYELVSEGDDWFFTMELVQGSDLISYLRAGRTPGHEAFAGKQLNLAEVVDEQRLRQALVQLASALEALHRGGVVHRDLKPTNIRVTPEGRLVVLDFGVAGELGGRDQDSTSGEGIGTPAFMAPEQAVGAAVSPAADWYGVGVLLYLALTTRLPFDGTAYDIVMAKQTEEPPDPRNFVAKLPADLVSICRALLQPVPAARLTGPELLARLGAGDSAEVAALSTFGGAQEVFVGRTAELATLHALYDSLDPGRSEVAFVVGASGIGKSTLVRQFLAEVEGDGGKRVAPVVLSGRCFEREAVPYKAFDGIVDQLTDQLLHWPQERTASLLPDDVDLITRLFPVMRRVPGVQTSRPLGNLGAREVRRRAFAGLRELLRRIAAWRPVVLCVDNLQWVDRDCADLLLDILRPPGAPRCLLLAAVRAEHVREATIVVDTMAELRQHCSSTVVALGPLPEPDQRQLVHELLGDAAAKGEVWWAEADGSPLLLSELVRYARDRDQRAGSDRELGAPVSLDAVLAWRVEQLPAAARKLGEATAVAEEPTPLGVLADAVGLDPTERENSFAVLRVAHIIRVATVGREPWLTCYHDRVREALAAGLDRERRRALHQQLALALERWDRASVDVLARHWLGAGDPLQAHSYLVAAARAASAKLAFARAAELYRAAFEIGEASIDQRNQLRRELGDALAMSGQCREASEVYRRAMVDADQDEAIDLSWLAVDNLLRSGEVQQGQRLARELFRRAKLRFPNRRAAVRRAVRSHRLRAAVRGSRYRPRAERDIAPSELRRLDMLDAVATRMGMIDPQLAAALNGDQLMLARRLGERGRVARAMAIQGMLCATGSGRSLRSAERLGQRVDLLARQLGDPYLGAMAHMLDGFIAYFGHRPRTALEAFRSSERAFVQGCPGAEWERVTARHWEVRAALWTGDVRGAVARAQAGLHDAVSRRDAHALGLLQPLAALWSGVMRDDVACSDRLLEVAISQWPTEPTCLAHYVHGCAAIEVELYRCRYGAALDRLRALRAAITGAGLERVPLVEVAYSALLARAGAGAGRREPVAEAVRRLRAHETGVGRAVEAAARYQLARLDGQLESAPELLLLAARLFEQAECAVAGEALRCRLGELSFGQRGSCRAKEAAASLAARGFARPAAVVQWLTPDS